MMRARALNAFSHRCGRTVVGMKWIITKMYCVHPNPNQDGPGSACTCEREHSCPRRVPFWRRPGGIGDNAT
jgi:hypothetical protein